MLHKYGLEHPRTGLADKVVGYQFAQKIDVTDPYTRRKDSKDIKPFMVNNSVNLFEKGKIILDPKDKKMISQLEEYRVKSISSTGRPIYTDENEHAIDAMNLALLIFEQKYGNLLKKVFSIKTVFIGTLDNRDVDVKSRVMGNTQDTDLTPFGVLPMKKPDLHNGVIGIIPTGKDFGKRKNHRAAMYTRRTF